MSISDEHRLGEARLPPLLAVRSMSACHPVADIFPMRARCRRSGSRKHFPTRGVVAYNTRMPASISTAPPSLAQLRFATEKEDFNFAREPVLSLSGRNPAEVRRFRSVTRHVGRVACVALDRTSRAITGPNRRDSRRTTALRGLTWRARLGRGRA